MANLHEIETNLWAMANKLRGKMDADNYKDYILAFMFYRYLSQKQDRYLIENEIIECENPADAAKALMYSIFYSDDDENGEMDLDKVKLEQIKKYAVESRNFTNLMREKRNKNDELVRNAEGKIIMEPVGPWVETYTDYLKDVTRSLGYFISPLYSWSILEEMLHNSMLIPQDYQGMFESFNFSLKYNVESEIDFKGIFNDVNLGADRLGDSVNARAKSLGEIIDLVNDIEYVGENGEDILGHIYEYLIKQFAATAGKKSGEFYTPHEVSLLMAKIVTADRLEAEPEVNDRNMENIIVRKAAAQKGEFAVFDPACGSGSLLLTVGKMFEQQENQASTAPQQETPSSKKVTVKYYGQELNTTTYNLARMNLMMNDVSYQNMVIRNADTLGPDWPLGIGKDSRDYYLSFNAVVANPPYSQKWDAPVSYLKDNRFKTYGVLAPKSKADFAFLLDGLYHLNKKGTMAIVLPHGVLFRGSTEGKIRQKLIEEGNIYAVIGLPANIFYGTSIPTIIMVLKKDRMNKDILFIDASKEFDKQKAKNSLTEEIIDKIFKIYLERKDVEKYAHLASFEEIKNNDYNLNIPRYVDTSEQEEQIDLEKVENEIADLDLEIERLEKELAALDAQIVKRMMV